MEKKIIIDQLLNENNGSYKDLAEDAYDAGYQAALSQVKNTCTCTQGKGLDHDEHGKQYCIDCGNYTKSAVQGYRKALERIRLITHYKAIQNDNMEMIIHSANQITQAALSKAEDKGVQTYGEFMRSNPQIPKFNLHPESSNPIATDRTTIPPQPTNTLDELERWIEQRSQSSDSVSHMVLLSKIQELKTITT